MANKISSSKNNNAKVSGKRKENPLFRKKLLLLFQLSSE